MRAYGFGLIGFVLIMLTALSAVAAEEKAASAPPPIFRYGADFRLRQENFNYIPAQAGGFARGGHNNYIRMRSRAWGELGPILKVSFKARLANEFRYWNAPDMAGKPAKSDYRFPDEFVWDSLYIDIKKLMNETIDLRIGRQDLLYGNGMLVCDGTPGDGSRTFYFNAVKSTFTLSPQNSFDLVGVWVPYHDELVMNDVNRDLIGNEQEESGGFLYWKNKDIEAMPMEFYYMFKHEGTYSKVSGTNAPVKCDAANWNTLGFRLMPKFNDELSGNLEVAGQLGRQGSANLKGYGVDAFLLYAVPVETLKPAIEGGVYYLSGNDPDTADNEGWNPLWARFPQRSELYVFSYDGSRWSNLAQPRLRLNFGPWQKWKGYLGASYMYAPEDDGPGDGHERGWLYQGKVEYMVAENMLRPKDKLSTYILMDVLEPGNYYKEDDTAYFLRWEVMYIF